MKIKEISVETKRVYQYQSYSVGLSATLNDGDNVETEIKSLQETAGRLAMAQIKKDLKKNEN